MEDERQGRTQSKFLFVHLSLFFFCFRTPSPKAKALPTSMTRRWRRRALSPAQTRGPSRLPVPNPPVDPFQREFLIADEDGDDAPRAETSTRPVAADAIF